MKAIPIAICSTVFIFSGQVCAGDIYATGGWTEVIDANDLVSGAGSDLNSAYESSSDATSLDISNVEFYDVYVRRSDSNWHSDFALYVKRTGSGSGGGTISGGGTYHQVTEIDTKFFSGYLDRTAVTVRYKLEGMSISIPPDTYSTTVVLTVIDQ